MRKGGYKIIDLHDTQFTVGTAMMIAGIHDAIEGSYRKPLLISGLTVAGVEYADAYVTATTNESAFMIDVYGFTIKIESTNAVTVTTKK